MSGFLLKELVNTNIVGTGVAQNVNLFTVPVGHTYMIKKGHLRLNRGAAGADTINIVRSDAAGLNFRNVVEAITTAAAASTSFVNLTPATPTLQNMGTLVAEGGANQFSTIENLVCEAGTILRAVIPASFIAADNIDVAIDGVDYTI